MMESLFCRVKFEIRSKSHEIYEAILKVGFSRLKAVLNIFLLLMTELEVNFNSFLYKIIDLTAALARKIVMN